MFVVKWSIIIHLVLIDGKTVTHVAHKGIIKCILVSNFMELYFLNYVFLELIITLLLCISQTDASKGLWVNRAVKESSVPWECLFSQTYFLLPALGSCSASPRRNSWAQRQLGAFCGHGSHSAGGCSVIEAPVGCSCEFLY